jgi:adenylate cyclase
LPEQYRTSIDTINSSSEYLLKLVNELLEFSRFESTKVPLNRNKIHLLSLLKQIESLFRLQAKKKHLKFRCTRDNTLPEYVWADEIKLRQVLINLVNNAIKFTQSGHVILRAWGNDKLYFEVEDTGPGIPDNELLYVFEAFRQVSETHTSVDRSSRLQGVGLGLWISESLVTLMDGKIVVASKLGVGSKFRVTLPLDPVAPAPDKEPAPTSPFKVFTPTPAEQPLTEVVLVEEDASISTIKPSLYRILVVDDVMVNRTLIVKFLEGIDVEIQEASSGEEAIELWQSWHPCLILMDLYMPGIGGCEAVRQIRKQEAESAIDRPSTSILAITANAQVDREMAIAAGCQAVFAKPIQREALLNRVKENIQTCDIATPGGLIPGE